MKSLGCFELVFVSNVEEPGGRTREGNFISRVILCQGAEIAGKIAEAMVGEEVLVLPNSAKGSPKSRLAKVHEVKPCERFPHILSEDNNETWARVLRNLAIPDQEKVLFLYITRISGKTEKVGVFFTPRQLREMFPEGDFTCSLD